MIARTALTLSTIATAAFLTATAGLGSLSIASLQTGLPKISAPLAPAEPTIVGFAPFNLPEPTELPDLEIASHGSSTVGYMSYDYTHRLERGETLGQVLSKAGISGEQARAAISAMREQFDPRRMRAGQELQITLALPDAEGGTQEIERLAFDVEFPYRVVVSRSAEGEFEAFKDERDLDREPTEAAGTIRSSLFQAGAEAKVPTPVLARMIRMFSWDVDFQRDIRQGDRFAVIYDRFVDDAGEAIKSADVSAAALVLGGKRTLIYRYVTKDGHDGYYTADGKSVRKPLLRTPVDGARLSSRYGKRRHPILGYTKMHKGVDFAAPTGTPILASGDGTVEFVGRRGGYGKYIRLRHRSGYGTAYAHMSRYAKGMRKGRRVKQGQIIGYVGSTGRSTGPHLHYEVLVKGRHINPLSVKTLPGRELGGQELAAFKALCAKTEPRLVALIESASPTIVARANN